ncbi:MAG: cytochrome P460 family protein [Saprospiraceae bacterium]|nr:cytochrome P460 family protein [Saprospiraceae bacterium]MBK9043926.1 cytochrome P460 family protein [Saprospiraceae bacterium]
MKIFKNGNVIVFTFLLAIMAISCDKEEKANSTDTVLFEMAKDTAGYKWFKNSSSLLNKSAGSAHPQPFLRTRYNSVAATMLDTNGKIKAGSVFPEGSVVVKELFSSEATLGRFAILYKSENNENADDKGWVWGYVNADGSISESSSNKGKSCIGCHSQSGNIDYMLMNKFF